MKPELFKAILAMDAYNRGYNPGINNLTGTSLGLATIIDDSGSLKDPETGKRLDEPAGFYAIAYNYNGETIISYRGTDGIVSNDGIGGDLWNGWGVGRGSAAGQQAGLAFEFYNAVKATTGVDAATLSLTGHSLGGGSGGCDP